MRRVPVIAIVLAGLVTFSNDVRSQQSNSFSPKADRAEKDLPLADVMPGVPASTALLYGAFPGFECFPSLGKYMNGKTTPEAALQLAGLPDEVVKKLRSAEAKDRFTALKCLSQYAFVIRMAAWDFGDNGEDVVSVAFGKYSQPICQALKTLLPAANDAERAHVAAVLLMLEPTHAGAHVAFAKELRSDDRERRKTACALAGGARLAQSDIIAGLAETVKSHTDFEVRRAAAGALAQIGPKAATAIPALIDLLKCGDRAKEEIRLCLTWSRKYPVRNVALRALGEMGADARPAVPTIQEILQAATDEECHELIDCLVRIGRAAKDSVPTIRCRLKADNTAVRHTAAAAVLCFEPDDDPATKTLAADLRSESTETKQSALECIARLGPKVKSLVPPMIDALSNEKCRQHAALALGAMGATAEEAIPKLVEILTNDKLEFPAHQAAAQGLRGIGRASIPSLVKVLEDAPLLGYRKRIQFIADLWDKGNDSGVEGLVRILPMLPMLVKMLSNDAYWRPACTPQVVSALGEFGEDAALAVPALVRLLKLNDGSDLMERDSGVDLFAAAALGRLRRTAAPARAALLRAVQTHNNYIAAWALTQLDR